jgi:K+ transport systems, NAD-binding component
MAFRKTSSIEYGIIGLGRFGQALATTLAEAGKDVLVIDNNEDKIRQMRSVTENALVVTSLDKAILEETGIQNCDTVIICIGKQIDVSILTVLNVINLKVPRVIAKAISYEQGEVIEKLGAEVVYPESDMAIRLAKKLTTSRALDFINLNDDISITELKLTKKLEGKSILEINLRKRFGLNIIALVQNGKTTIEITPNLIVTQDDILVVLGKHQNILDFERFLS